MPGTKDRQAGGGVFVYGTLKPGESNARIARQAGVFTVREAYIEGFTLYDLMPEAYPAIVPGHGRVYGVVLDYEDLAQALPVLDELEGCGETPALYQRTRVAALPMREEVWVYVLARSGRLKQAGALLLEGGVWPPPRNRSPNDMTV